ncbi:MAG: hypothetical protein AABW46_02315 [Nanoarchaeota archaeon]
MVKVKIINEVLGSPKDHVEKTLKLLMDAARRNKDFKINSEKIFEARKLEDNPFFSAFTELEIEFKDLQDLIGFCFDFMPSSIEILEPGELKMDSIRGSDLFNELMARLHQNDMALKNALAELAILKKKR